MVNKCCVPKCKTNYKSGNKHVVFSFPKNEVMKKKWTSAVGRENFQPSKHSRVCELHFTDHDIRRTAEEIDVKTGRKIVVNLLKPRLHPGAIPSVFPDCDPIDTKDKTQKRVHIECMYLKSSFSEEEESEYEEKYTIPKPTYTFKDYSEFLNCLSDNEVSGEWVTVRKKDVVVFAVISLTNFPEISHSAIFNSSLELRLFNNCSEIKTFSGENYPKKMNNIKDLFAVLHDFESYSGSGLSLDDVCQNTIASFQNLNTDHEDSINKKIFFLSEQLNLLPKKKECFRYSTDTLIYCSLLYYISPHAYHYIRSTGFLNIPHPKTLTKICLRYNSCNENYLRYRKQQFNLLNISDRTVSLMLDEIDIKQYFDHKVGNIVGMSCKQKRAATTAYVFMIQSLLSSYKDVVHVFPVNNIKGKELSKYIKKVIIDLHAVGFNVVCVVSDNNAINKRAMTYFNSPPKFDIVYIHPADQSKPLFFIFDTVHILKRIRNNWIKQDNQIIIYPNFDLSTNTCTEVADFNILKIIYDLDKSNLVKYAHTLNMKSLNPSSHELENVQLTLNIFNRHVHNAVLTLGLQNNLSHYTSTAIFIEIILKWWDIVNVKTLLEDKDLRNSYMSPLCPNQDNYIFLNKCLMWLDRWSESQNVTNKLTKQTHFAFSHSTYALIQLTNYCVNELKFKYLLPGKIQTDHLKDRFG